VRQIIKRKYEEEHITLGGVCTSYILPLDPPLIITVANAMNTGFERVYFFVCFIQ